MNTGNNSKPKRKPFPSEVLETTKEIGKNTLEPFKRQLEPFPKNFSSQLFGHPRSFSGEISPGEQVQLREIYSGQRDKQEKLKNQLILERRLHEEEKILVEKKTNELKIQLHTIMEEIRLLAQSTPNLVEEVEIATLQVPANPGVYHVFFFERILEFIKSFREKIENASIWIHAVNKRAQKKNYWNRYKKHGGKFLLSADHYLTRSAG